eukprot:TRINITY_DN12479_c0_g1_i1.p1 TRINITY_DN12479_c0_g1~~TRINITY_DN12479_c0_g1_i1.p1  ORF type:complete len:179 (-),score=29.35 TRINITY_DN12479_c0_g1_i1:39-575(-)
MYLNIYLPMQNNCIEKNQNQKRKLKNICYNAISELIVSKLDNSLIIWQKNNFQLLKTIDLNCNEIKRIHFSPNGGKLAICYVNLLLEIYQTSDFNQEPVVLELDSNIDDFEINDSADYIFTTSNRCFSSYISKKWCLQNKKCVEKTQVRRFKTDTLIIGTVGVSNVLYKRNNNFRSKI